MLKIATFNVNSVKARLPRLLEWLKTSNPDIVCLQELKCEENAFPFEALLDAGYNSAVCGQKTYNGVAILSKYKIEDVVKGLPDFDANSGIDGGQDLQARYIEAVISFKSGAIRVASVYVPNGGGDLNEGEKLEEVLLSKSEESTIRKHPLISHTKVDLIDIELEGKVGS
jgi:exodeoxyribonuclease-3